MRMLVAATVTAHKSAATAVFRRARFVNCVAGETRRIMQEPNICA
jgi:hypothetical protein